MADKMTLKKVETMVNSLSKTLIKEKITHYQDLLKLLRGSHLVAAFRDAGAIYKDHETGRYFTIAKSEFNRELYVKILSRVIISRGSQLKSFPEITQADLDACKKETKEQVSEPKQNPEPKIKDQNISEVVIRELLESLLAIRNDFAYLKAAMFDFTMIIKEQSKILSQLTTSDEKE